MTQPRTHRHYDREFKLSVVRPIANGTRSPAEICREYGLANSVLDRWRKEYDQLGDEAFQPQQKWSRSRPVSAEALEGKAPEISAADEGSDANRLDQLEQLCSKLSLLCELLSLEILLRRARSHSDMPSHS